MGYIGNAPYQGVITGGDIADGTIEEADIKNDAVTTQKIEDANITEGKLADSAVTTAKIANNAVTDAKLNSTKLDGIETGATADQTGAEIKTAYESQSNTNAFTDAEKTKLSGIEASADVTDTTNVVAALTAGSDINIAGDGTISYTGASDVVSDTTPQLGGNLDGNGYSINLKTGQGVTFGDNNELTMAYEGGSGQNSVIRETAGGNLYIDASHLVLRDRAGSFANYINCETNGAVTAYYDGAEKLATTSTGIDVTGKITTDRMVLPNYTATERNALTSVVSGDTIYNSTTGSIEFYDGTNWIATNLIPNVNSVTGTIYAGAASTLTLSITNATDTVTVRFSEGGATVADVDNVTVTSGSASVSVPAAVYGQTVGDTISVSILNQDGTPSSNAINKTVLGLPTGGTITTSGGYRYHTFTSSGTFTNTITSLSAEYLVVAGGGGGGGEHGGGGGAGGYISSSTTASVQSYSITVGSGGAGSTSPRPGAYGGDGSNSSAFGSTANGGGSGGYRYANGRSGGSGGGAGADGNFSSGGAGTSGQGFAGGGSTGTGDPYQGGGGGGASEVGVTAAAGTSIATHGGDGKTWLNGTTYAGGGGGGVAYSGTAIYGTGGAGGGGRGATTTATAVSGSANTGGGGGGANRYATGGNHQASSIGSAGNGGSGIVIVRYQL